MTVTHSPIAWMTVAFVLLFFPLAMSVPPEYLFGVLNAITFSASIAVIVAYSRGIYDALITNERIGGHLLILGLACHWLASSARHLFMWIWRFQGEPDAWINSPWLGLIPWLTVYGACLHLAARDAPLNHVPSRNLKVIGVALGVGLALALLVIWFGGGAPHFS